VAETDLTADQCKIGRAAVGWSAQDLAAAAGVDAGVIHDLENDAAVAAVSSRKILAAFADAGVSFVQGPDGKARMRVRTLDGIIEAPVTMAPRS
jgi:ribosome-binding protein aMBF1 (putative translation factor)